LIRPPAILLGVVVAAAWPLACAAGGAQEEVQRLDAQFAACLADPELGRAQSAPKPADLKSLCPDLVAAVNASEFGDLLPGDWADAISRERLGELRAALAASQPPAVTVRVSPDALPAILKRLEVEQRAPPLSLWQRFKNWLQSLFERQQAREQGPNWLVSLLRKLTLGKSALAIVNYAVLVLLLGAAAAIVFVELRAAGLLRPGGSGAGRRWRRTGTPQGSAILSLEDVGRAPLTDRPALLLRLLIERCVATGRLEERGSLTHRELERAARFEDQRDGSSFRHVLGIAESVRYAPRPPGADALDAAVRDGEALLGRLAASPGSAR